MKLDSYANMYFGGGIPLINEKIVELGEEEKRQAETLSEEKKEEKELNPTTLVNQGSCIVDATACRQDISYPTDLNLLNDGREKSE